ncbi:MAG TPA: serine/threonine-protein kinase, partial [Kofleriaceae bacterium]|nr:serine/threonine-protein kinase [Kofleriaceae bacterium]
MIEELGSGGMATVYRARDRELRRDVAIKVLFPHLCKNREVVARFQREARAAAGLDHPNILRVFDVGGGAEGGGDPPFIVLELVRGPSLVELAAAGPLLAELAAACGVAIAAALGHAHRAGVIHRDVKPGNLLVAEGGRLVLADFGVARVAEDDSSLVTRTGALLGTPAFMSPEQATGGELDARSDLYSAGATLYQLATGSVPVSGSAARAVAAIVAGEVVPPLRRNPAMGRELARVIERLMAVDPGERIQSAAELEAELRAIATAAGAGEPDALMAELFAGRAACEARVAPLAVASSVARARRALVEGNTARALALCDRALALDAGCREATEIATSIGARRMWRRVALVLGIVVLLAGGAVAGWMMWPSGDEKPQELAAAVPAVVFDAMPAAAEVADAAPERQTQDAGDGGRGT